MMGLRGCTGVAGRLMGMVALTGGVLALGAFAASAQDKGKEDPAPIQWVKLCQDTMVTHFPKEKDAKPTQVKKNICRTRYEQLAPFAAMSVQVQKIADVDDLGLIISFSLPQPMAIKPGILAAVYSAAQFEKVKKKVKVDSKELLILKVGYTRCGTGECSAEVPAPKDLIEDMKKGAVMVVKAFRGDGQVIEVDVPLKGFTSVLEGKPTDLAKYQEARQKALAQLSARRSQILAEERARREGVKIPDPQPIVKQ